MIDIHVHFRDWNQRHKETLEHGIGLAAALGYTAVCDMPNTDPPLLTAEDLERRLVDAAPFEKKYGVHYYCYGGATPDPEQLRGVIIAVQQIERVAGLKYFASHSTGNMGIIEEKQQKEFFETLVRYNYTGFLAIHAEDTACFKTSRESGILKKHHEERPIEAEVSAVKKQIAFAKEGGFRGHLHICHATNTAVIDVIEQERPSCPFPITVGVTSSHLLLNLEEASDLCKINPPIRPRSEQEKLYQALLDNRIDLVESDHAPHTLEDKRNGVSGIPSLPGQIRLLHRLYQDKVSFKLIRKLYGGTAQKILGIDTEITLPTEQNCEELISQFKNDYPFDPYESNQK